MEEQFRFFAGYVALALEALTVIAVAAGAVEALATMARRLTGWRRADWLRLAWLRFAGWVLIALEFALGADIIRSAIAPTWDDIGKLGVIAVIRTLLGFFLGRDMAEARAMEAEGEKEASRPLADA